MNIFRKKDPRQTKTEMVRNLRTIDLVFLGLGSMVGTGIFTITGIGAAEYAGPSLMISIILAAIAVGISALFYAEFASRLPANGGAYSYVYATLGEFPAWLVGWMIIMEFLTAISSVASGWGSYLKGLLASFGITLPKALSGTFDPNQGHYIDLLPVLVMVAVTALVLLNSKSILRFNSFLVILKFSALALFIIAGIFFINTDNWTNFAPFGFIQPHGGKGILAGASIMFFAFLGFESLSMTVDEVKEPQKTVPRGIILSLIVVTILYILVTLVLTGMVHYTKLGVDDAVAFALRHVGLAWAANYVSTVAILTLITVCISMTFALSRTVYSISRDGLLPKELSAISEKTKTPNSATFLVGIFAIVFTGIIPLASLAEFVNICTLAYLIVLAIALIKLRKDKASSEEDQFKTPLVPILPIISIIISLFLMSQFKMITWIAFGIALLLGILIYYLYGYKNSIIKDN
ncbi:APC family permease [Streptococcus dentapri]|uniref:APC family permease n=1 Tax=Streptococcus dentapri TaxID=573564 RepID=A0ABV8D2J4_9STRE